MRAGSMNKRITIAKLARIKNEVGEYRNQFKVIANKWSKVQIKNLGQTVTERDEVSTTEAIFDIRYERSLLDFTPDTVVKFNGKVYKVKNVINVNEANKILRIFTILRV